MGDPAEKLDEQLQFKSYGLLARKGAGDASAEDLATINQYTLRELSANEVYVRSVYLAHNAIDRDGEIFSDPLLANFADTLPGKGVFVKHPGGWDGDSGPGQGRWFKANVLDVSQDEARSMLKEPRLRWAPDTTMAKILVATFYMLRMPDVQTNTELLAKIDAGIAGDFSIGFAAAGRTEVIDPSSGERIAMRWLAPGEAREGSLVWLGAQPGARIFKNANAKSETEKEEQNMAEETLAMLKEQNEALDKQNKTLKETADTNQAKAAAFDAIEAACGEDAVKSPERMARAIQDGESARKSIVDSIVGIERAKGLVGDTEEDLAKAKAVYEDRDLEYLQNVLDHSQKTMGGDAGDEITGGQHTRDDNSNGGKKGLRDSSVTKGALGTDK